MFLPGGHGTMFDLPGDPALRQLLTDFFGDKKVVAAICHGPAGLVNLLDADGDPLVAGRTVTAFTDEEEREVKLAIGAFPARDEAARAVLRELGVMEPAGTAAFTGGQVQA